MTRILHVVSALKKNGTETFLINILRNIDREKFKFDFLIFNEDKDGYYPEVKSLGCEVYFLPPRRAGLVNYHRQLDHFFKDKSKEYDVIHIHDMSLSSVAPLYFAKKYGIPKRIMHIHGSNCNGIHNKIFHKINRHRIASLATHYLSCSAGASAWGYSKSPALKKSTVIPNGIDLDKFKFDQIQRDKIREELKIDKDRFTIVHVGGFNAIKNHKFLLDVVKQLQSYKPDVKLICAGVGTLLPSIKEYASKLNLEENVLFLGHRDDVSSLMSAADMLIFPSLHEGLGLVVVEAQASGLPVVVSTGVPQEVGVSASFYRIDLNKGVDYWAKYIAGLDININRDNNPEIERYSIEKTIEMLSKIYLS